MKNLLGCKNTMSLETHIAGSEDRLIDGLHFAGRNTASYGTARRATTFSPSSAAAWAPNGVRLVRFNLADHAGWLDGGTLRLCFTLSNLATTTLDPIAVSPAAMFRRLRLIANGSSVLEDSDNGRTYQLMSELLPCQRRMNDTGETWGGGNAALSFTDPGLDDPIPGDSSRQVAFSS